MRPRSARLPTSDSRARCRSRALFMADFHSATTCLTAGNCSIKDSRLPPSSRSNAGAATLYRLGTLLAKTGENARARAAYERALTLQPDLAEANNDLGALLA